MAVSLLPKKPPSYPAVVPSKRGAQSVVIDLPEAFDFLSQELADDGSPVSYRAMYGGRGSAKSESVARVLVVRALSRNGYRILCCREIQKSMRDSVKKILDDQIDAMGLRWYFTSTDTEIRGLNGSLFIFHGLRTNPDNIKSLQGIDLAWVEEAATVSQSSLEILTPSIRKDGAEIWFTWNPRFEKDPVDVMFRGGEPPPGTILRRVNWDDNPWFPLRLQRDMEWDRRRDPDKYAHIWLGEYQRNSEARVFKNWTIEDFETPSDARFYFGGDFGFARDPTVLVRCWLDDLNRRLYVDFEAYLVGCEIDDTPRLWAGKEGAKPEQLAEWTAFHDDMYPGIPEAKRWGITADSSRPETISYMNRNGFRVSGAVKGAGSVEEGVKFLQSYDIVVHPRCPHVIDELTLYSFEIDKKTREILPKLADKDNHCIDALRYATERLRRVSGGDGIQDFMREEAAKLANVAKPIEARDLVKMTPPYGVNRISGMEREYVPDAEGFIYVTPSDAQLFERRNPLFVRAH